MEAANYKPLTQETGDGKKTGQNTKGKKEKFKKNRR